MCDNLVKYTIEQTLPWYPLWAVGARAFTTVLHIQTYTDVLVQRLVDMNMYGSGVLLASVPANMIRLRWGSVVRTAQGLMERKVALHLSWSDADFQDTVDVKQVFRGGRYL